MDEQTTLKANKPWWVHAECASDVQALVGGGFKHLPVGRALFFAFDDAPPSGQWILNLEKVATITPASESSNGQEKAVALGLTATGLARCGLNTAAIEAFGPQFYDGMTEYSRARRLGDIAVDQLQWSGSDASLTQVHLVLLTYCEDETDLDGWCRDIVDVLVKNGITLRHQLNLEMRASSKRVDGKPVYREHFGFADGISQPVPIDDKGDKPAFTHRSLSESSSPYHEVSSGDFLFGRKNSYGELAPSPFVAEKAAAGLQKGNAPIGTRDFAFNGTFLVIRQLSQDVEGFLQHMREAADDIGMSPDDLAEKLVGRTKDGAILSKNKLDYSNDRGFAEYDSSGLDCPLGSHIRRANPRDDGGKGIGSRRSKLAASNKHRILRRGRNYTIDQNNVDPSKILQSRGLLFMCLNTDIRRQFEFIQTTWLNSRHFSNLNETDPLLGSAGTSTIQSEPLRLKPTIESFVKLIGGDYFFMPSIAAIKYLSKLESPGDST